LKLSATSKVLRDLGNGYYNLSLLSNQASVRALPLMNAVGAENHEHAIETFEDLLTTSKNSIEYKVNLAMSNELLAAHYLLRAGREDSGLFPTSAQYFETAIGSMRTLRNRNPAVPSYGTYLAAWLDELAFVKIQLRDQQKAKELSDEAASIRDELGLDRRNNDPPSAPIPPEQIEPLTPAPRS
jgi:hypothetical protein